MANVIQAAQWMKEGKSVRRASWQKGQFVIWYENTPTQMVYLSRDFSVYADRFMYMAGEQFFLRLDSIQAEDWEIYE